MKFPILMLFFLKTNFVFTFDPSKINYCLIPCKDNQGTVLEHTACKCKVKKHRHIIYDDIVSFRQEMIDAHNYWRNLVASGAANETNKFVTSASNMRIMNYDLELEYIASCLAGKFKEDHDICRRNSKDQGVGQNIAGSPHRTENLTFLINTWYDEIEYIVSDENIADMTVLYTEKGVIGHFSQLIWASADLVGCMKVWNRNANLSYRLSLICDYGSTTDSGSQIIGKPIYKRGDSCSDCYPELQCETTKYPALCGKLLPIPLTPAIRIDAANLGSDLILVNPFSLVAVLFVLALFY